MSCTWTHNKHGNMGRNTTRSEYYSTKAAETGAERDSTTQYRWVSTLCITVNYYMYVFRNTIMLIQCSTLWWSLLFVNFAQLSTIFSRHFCVYLVILMPGSVMGLKLTCTATLSNDSLQIKSYVTRWELATLSCTNFEVNANITVYFAVYFCAVCGHFLALLRANRLIYKSHWIITPVHCHWLNQRGSIRNDQFVN